MRFDLSNLLSWRHRVARAADLVVTHKPPPGPTSTGTGRGDGHQRMTDGHHTIFRLGVPFCRRRAFTLLEVILAIAILGAALAALGEVVRLSGENANAARDLSQAQLLAASKMAEIASGAVELTTVSRASLDVDADPPWVYQVEMTNTIADDLVAVHVTVEQDRPEAEQPIQFTLVRWMPDPGALPESTDSGSSTGGGSSSTGESGGR